MSIPVIITLLDKMAALHADLLDLAVRKAEMVKANKVEELQELTKDEKQYVLAISQLEQQRMQLLPNKTISDLIAEATGGQKNKLQELKDRLTATIQSIQKQNELNQQLLQQSMQFVAMSINALNPQQQAVTYEKPLNKQKSTIAPARSMFDSKA